MKLENIEHFKKQQTDFEVEPGASSDPSLQRSAQEVVLRNQEIEAIRNELHYLNPYSKTPDDIHRREELHGRLKALGVTVV